MDFFTVRTVTFGVLYCFFVISHNRRRILHFNFTRYPTSQWVVQQLREAFPYESAPRFLIFDRDAKYGTEVPAAIFENQKDSHFVRESLAEWRCRALGSELPPRLARPRDSFEQEAPHAAAFR